MKLNAKIFLHAILLLTLAIRVPASRIEGNWQATQRDKEIAQLIAIIRDSQLRIEDPNKVVEAIRRLGEMEAVSAVDDLAQLLAFRPISRQEILPGTPRIITEADKRFPAVSALYLIGKPSLPALIKIVENFDDQDLMSRNAELTIVAIFRDKLPDGAEYVNQAASKSSAQGKQRLLNLAERMNRIIREAKHR